MTSLWRYRSDVQRAIFAWRGSYIENKFNIILINLYELKSLKTTFYYRHLAFKDNKHYLSIPWELLSYIPIIFVQVEFQSTMRKKRKIEKPGAGDKNKQVIETISNMSSVWVRNLHFALNNLLLIKINKQIWSLWTSKYINYSTIHS